MQKYVGVVIVLVLLVGLGVLLYLGGVFGPRDAPELTGAAVVEREEVPPKPDRPRPGRLQIFVADQETNVAIPDFEMRREPAPSENWIRNKSVDGRFEISGVLKDRMRLRVRADGYLANHVDILYANIPEDEVMEAFTFQLERGYEARGTVLDDATGEPLEGAFVRAMDSIQQRDFEDYPVADPDVLVARTNAQGEFSLTVSPPEAGAYIVAWHPEHAVLAHEVASVPPDKLALRLKPGGHKYFTLIQNSEVVGPMTYRLDQPQLEAETSEIPLTSTPTVDGSAAIRYAPEGIYRVIIDVPDGGGEWGRAAVAIAHDDQPSVVWDVDEFGGIFGTVKGIHPEAKALVSLVDSRYPFVNLYETPPDADGLFEFGFIPVGLYTIRVTRADAPDAPTERQFNVTNGEWREVDVSMLRKPVAPAS